MEEPINSLNRKQDNFKSSFLKIICIVSVFVIVFLMNRFTPMALDDYSYYFSFATDKPITSLSQIIPSMKIEYQTANGRLLTHSLVQAGMIINPIVFDFLNSALFVVMIFLICYQMSGSIKKISGKHILFSFIFIWLFSPNFAQPFLWHDGSLNYMLPASFLLVAMIPYRKFFCEFKKGSISKSIFLSMTMLIVGFCVGYSNESVSVIFIVLQILFAVAFVIRKYKLRIWMLFSFAGNFVGLTLMLSSPAYSKRSDIWGEGSYLEIIIEAIKKVPTAIKLTIYSLFVPLLLFFLAVVLFFIIKRKKPLREILSENTDNLIVEMIFMIATIIFGLLSCVCDYFPERIWVPAVLFILISITVIISDLQIKKSYTTVAIIIIAVVTLCLSCIPEIKKAAVLSEKFIQREEYIANEKEKGNYDLELSPIYGDSKYSVFLESGDISDDKETIWIKDTFIKYYGLHSVKIVE